MALPEGTDTFGLSVASCVLTRIPDPKDASKFIVRPYTPVTTERESQATQQAEFIIKAYADGVMSTHLTGLKPGDSMQLKGPLVKIRFQGPQDERLQDVQHIGMLAGGTGITPMLQVLGEVLRAPSSAALDHLRFTLLFANRSEEDILCKEHLDALVRAHPNRLAVHYVLEKLPSSESASGSSSSSSSYLQGFISESLIRQYMPKPSQSSSMVFVCGPDPMLAAFAGPKNPDKSQGPVLGLLKELGYSEANVFKF